MENLAHKDLDMKKAVYCDLDGTLCDCEHRRHHLERNDWPSFFAGMCDDTIIVHTEQVLRALCEAGYAIIIGSARPDENNYKEMTVEWLNRHKIPYSAIYMRKGGDYRKDSIVKIEILDQMLSDGWDIQFALDDRQQVVQAFREYGLPVFQVNDGDFDDPKQNKLRKEYVGKPLLHVLVGPSGAGKSTYIQEQIRKGVYKEHQIVSSDKVRDELFGGHENGEGHDSAELARTWRYIHKTIQARVSEGVFTVLDATNLKRKDRMELMKFVPPGAMVTYVVIDREYDEKLKTRGWRPEKLVAKHHQIFKSNLKDILKGDDHPYVTVQDKRLHKV